MISVDREQFDAHLAELCAGFNVPLTNDRKDAYWKGLAKMDLPRFARCVEHALGEHGPEKFPSTGAVWGIWRHLRAHRPPPQSEVEPPPPFDNFHAFGQRRLLDYLNEVGGGLSENVLSQLIAVKNQIVDAMRLINTEERITGAEFRDRLLAEFRRVTR